MKRFLIILLILVIAIVGIGFYFYTKKPADTGSLTTNYTLTAIALIKEFNDDESVATKKYADKVVLVSGEVSEINMIGDPSIQLKGDDPFTGITCSFYADELPQVKLLKAGDQITVKGKCTGKLMGVVLNNCRIQKQ